MWFTTASSALKVRLPGGTTQTIATSADIANIGTTIGNLNSLVTVDKSTLVAAINETVNGPATRLLTARNIAITGDATWSVSFDGQANVSSGLVLNSSGVVPGTYGTALKIPQLQINAKGLVTAVTEIDVPHTFLSLQDTPNVYAGAGSYQVRVRADELGLEFVPGSDTILMQEVYESSTAPHIVTTLAQPTLVLRTGSGNNANNVLAVQNAAGTTTFAVQGDGVVTTGPLNASSVLVTGNLTVQGTTTFIDTDTLRVEDKNIELGVVTTPTDVTANGGGITLLGSTNKTWQWQSSSAAWTSSEHIDLQAAKTLMIGGVTVLSATALGTLSGASLTNLNATALTTGTVTPARLGSGVTDASTYLAGDQTWKPVLVTSVHSRTGAIVSQVGDYHQGQIVLNPARSIGAQSFLETTQDQMSLSWSSGVVDGVNLTDNGNGTITLSAGTAVVRSSASSYAPMYTVAVAGNTLSLTNQSLNYIHVDYNGGVPVVANTTNINTVNGLNRSIAWAVFRDGTSLHSLDLRGQNVDASQRIRTRFLAINRFDHAAGGTVLSGSGLALTVSAGMFFVMINQLPHVAFDTTIAGTANANVFTLWYRNGAGGWVETPNQKVIDANVYDSNAGTPTALSGSQRAVSWVYIMNDNPSELHVVMGQDNYGSLANAQAATPPSVLPPILGELGVLIGEVIYQRLGTVFQEVRSAFTTVFGTSAVTNHNDLGGLQGGAANEYYHLTAAEHIGTGTGVVVRATNPTLAGLTSSSSVLLSNTAPTLVFDDTDAGADNRRFRVRTSGTGLIVDLQNDAQSVTSTAYQINRTSGSASIASHVWSVGSTTEAARIDSSGNFMVGTASSAVRLRVDAGGPARGIIGTLRATGNLGAQLHFNQDTVADWSIGQVPAINAFAIYSGRSVTTDGTEHLRVDSSGNLGVGGTSAGARAHIIAGAGTESLRVGNTGTARVFSVQADANGVWAGNGTSSLTGEGLYYQNSINALRFYTNTTERMRVTSGGDVGIGNSAPATKIHVGNGSTNDLMRFAGPSSNTDVGNTATGVLLGTANNVPVYFTTNGTERMRIDAAGNTGLGIIPAAWNNNYRVHQLGTGAWVGGRVGTAGLELGSNWYRDGAANYVRLNTDAVTQLDINAGAFVWSNAASGVGGSTFTFTQRMALDLNGNLGIGRTPGQLLDIQGSAATVARIRGGSSAGQGASYHVTLPVSDTLMAAFGDRATVLGGTPGQLVSIFTAAATPLTFDVAAIERVRIDASGNMGIGVASAGNALHVYRGGANASYAQFGNGATGAASGNGLLFGVDSAGTAIMTQQSAFPLVVSVAGAERLRIDTSGNVITNVATAAPTLSTNQQMVFALTSNTNLRISVRGTDGVTRVANITLA